MLTIGVTGLNTTIVQQTVERLNAGALRIADCSRVADDGFNPVLYDHYVLGAGLLLGKSACSQTVDEMELCSRINLLSPIFLCERILIANPLARVAVIGSKSGDSGSYDMVYAACKAGLHGYVRNRHVSSRQSLVCIIPPIISDAGMTLRRLDYGDVVKNRKTVTTKQVVDVVVRALVGLEFLGCNALVSL